MHTSPVDASSSKLGNPTVTSAFVAEVIFHQLIIIDIKDIYTTFSKFRKWSFNFYEILYKRQAWTRPLLMCSLNINSEHPTWYRNRMTTSQPLLMLKFYIMGSPLCTQAEYPPAISVTPVKPWNTQKQSYVNNPNMFLSPLFGNLLEFVPDDKRLLSQSIHTYVIEEINF